MARGRTDVYALLDRDFDVPWEPPQRRPIPWVEGNALLGWRWERKELENYLLDPHVVRKALGWERPDESRYEGLLQNARDRLACYQAARIALFRCRPRRVGLSNRFGKSRGRENYPFPESLGLEDCRQGVRKVINEFGESRSPVVEEVLERMSEAIPEFELGSSRLEEFMTAFAGKDLAWAMDEDLRNWRFQGATIFCEQILTGIENASGDIWEWLPEWKELRLAVERV
jgi:hypothetical protein